MNETDKNLQEKKSQVDEVLNDFATREPPEISFDGVSKQTDDLIKAFDITKRMAKVYTSITKGFVYAAFCREGTTMKSHLMLVVKYPNGELSEGIRVDQDLIFDMSYQPNATKANRLNWVKNSKCLEVLRKYCTPNMKIDYVEIFCTLRRNYDKIPVIEISDCSPIYEVYKAIRYYVQSKRDGINIYSTCEDYPLTTADLIAVAKEEGYTAESLIQQMVLHDLLITDGGAKNRWQKSMRPCPKENPIRYYVVKNEEKLRQMTARDAKDEKNIEITPAEIPCPNGITPRYK